MCRSVPGGLRSAADLEPAGERAEPARETGSASQAEALRIVDLADQGGLTLLAREDALLILALLVVSCSSQAEDMALAARLWAKTEEDIKDARANRTSSRK